MPVSSLVAGYTLLGDREVKSKARERPGASAMYSLASVSHSSVANVTETMFSACIAIVVRLPLFLENAYWMYEH